MTDLVVVLPGIMGSTLADRHDRLVWAPSSGSVLRAIGTLGDSIRDLALPAGIGDDHPGDGVRPVAVMPDLHIIPGIWSPIRGYTELVRRIRAQGFQLVSDDPAAPPGNLLVVPYDWRLSIRYNGRRLKSLVEPALERWRSRGGLHRDAKVSFVCHSLGGLVARWYIAREGGAEVTRKLITMGTPYRGAARAVDQLVRGVRKDVGPISVDLTAFARSLPSLYQLLPSFACVEHGRHTADGLTFLGDLTAPPVLDTARVADAMLLYHQLEDAETGLPMASMRHALTGIQQTTGSTVRVTATDIEVLDLYAGSDIGGDGTVPAVAGPKGVSLDDPTLKRIADKHGDLQCNKAMLDEVVGVLTGTPLVPRAGEAVEPRVDVPELIVEGEALPVTVRADTRDAIKVTVVDEQGRVLHARKPRPRDGVASTVFSDLTPGAHTVLIAGLLPSSPIQPVTSNVLVWGRKR